MNSTQAFAYIIRIARPFYGSIAVMVMIAIIWSIDLSLKPYLLKIIVNRASENGGTHLDSLIGPAVIFVGMTLILSLSFRLYDYCISVRMIPQLRAHVVNDAFARFIQHSHSFYQSNFSGSLANKVNDLSTYVPEIIQITIDRFFSHTLALSVAVYTLWQVNIVFAAIMFAWICLFLAVSLLSLNRVQQLSDRWSELGSTITGQIVDVLSNMLSVRLFARGHLERQRLSVTCEQTTRAEKKLQITYFWIWLCYGLSVVVMQAFNLYFLIQGRQNGTISVGDFALVLTLNLTIVEFLWQLTREFSQFAKGVGKITQALRIATRPVDIVHAADAKPLVVSNGEIVFDHVRFHYPEAKLLFEKTSVTIKAGQKVGLVGSSGGGKSTFVNLILRLFDVDQGEIRIDGQNIAHVQQDSLRQQIAMIPQDPALFHRSLLANIQIGKEGATETEVIRAAKQAHTDEFITQIPKGYEALVGERGIKLSGGQRQRIAIARAILKNAPILMLDEATSQLDSLTERLIQDSLWDLMQNKTTLVVAHRLSTLLNMDRILVFDQGQIVEDGTHQELLDKGGVYKTLWDAQVGGFLPDESLEA